MLLAVIRLAALKAGPSGRRAGGTAGAAAGAAGDAAEEGSDPELGEVNARFRAATGRRSGGPSAEG